MAKILQFLAKRYKDGLFWQVGDFGHPGVYVVQLIYSVRLVEDNRHSSLECSLLNLLGFKILSEPALVEIRDLNFAYDKRPILEGINMTIPKGKLIAIMGLSGCGKTTLLRHIGGALRPTKGYVKVGGQVIHELDQDGLYAMRRKMGLLFQFGALFTDMSVFDNVAFQMREHTDLPEELIHDLVLMKLHAVGLRSTHELMPSELSGGMARRVALARTIALDPISLTVVGDLIRRLNDALGATSIVVTHDVQESLKIVDYVYFMANGVIVAEGTPEEIRASDRDFVHQFVHGEMDGPVPFHYPGGDYRKDLNLQT